MKLILASQSPRRAQILRDNGFSPTVIPAHIIEIKSANETPSAYVLRLAHEKAHTVSTKIQVDNMGSDDHETVILAADTTVVLGENILEKPHDAAEALAMLQSLSGTTHQVLTGYTLLFVNAEKEISEISECVQTAVTFHKLTKKQIQDYVDSGDPFDKAGAYGIQSVRGSFVQSIDGSYWNVMGLPIEVILDKLNTHPSK